MTESTTENIHRLLRLYYSGRLDKETNAVIQGWLLDDNGRQDKDACLVMVFDKIIDGQRNPDQYTRRSLSSIHTELAFANKTTRFGFIPFARLRHLLAMVGVMLLGIFVKPDPVTFSTIQSSTAYEIIVVSDSGTDTQSDCEILPSLEQPSQYENQEDMAMMFPMEYKAFSLKFK